MGGLRHIPQSFSSNHFLNEVASPDFNFDEDEFSKFYNEIFYGLDNNEDSDNEFWYDTSEVFFREDRVKSAADLQQVLHSSYSRLQSTFRSSGSLYEKLSNNSTSNLSTNRPCHASTRQNGSPERNRTTRFGKNTRERILRGIATAASKSPNPVIGISNLLACKVWDWSQSILSVCWCTITGDPSYANNPKKWTITLSCLGLLTLLIFKTRRKMTNS